MQFVKVQRRPEDVGHQEHYVVDLSASDIHRPSSHLVAFAEGCKTFSFLNTHTVDEFTRQVLNRYVENIPPMDNNEMNSPTTG